MKFPFLLAVTAGAILAIGSAVARADSNKDCDARFAITGSGFSQQNTNAAINYIGAVSPSRLLLAGNVNGYKVTGYMDLVGFTASGSWGDEAGAAGSGGSISSIEIRDKTMTISGWVRQGGPFGGVVYKTGQIQFAGDVSFSYTSVGDSANSKINYIIPWPSNVVNPGKGLFLGGTTFDSRKLPNGSFYSPTSMLCKPAASAK
ncbi:hypothetical protein DK842_21235 [Chromobacterium phragmitis]|uniref:hypothetical protein n=1 Tax=Chromobacterium phragmitis TaxID=2202141 RepID=UPI000DEC5C38|nr:hypothetical protein [Chromobacterium phragmitis]AXE32207.1 hypothetical protein DK842_21235 [Chromobacterium phragmitis]